MSTRAASTIERDTKETQISLTFSIDGTGQSSIRTGVAFFDHMLDLFTVHGFFDLSLTVKGDLEVDAHHTVEDTGICLGQAFKQCLGDAKGIHRYASVILPMDEALCQMALDISNRPVCVFNYDFPKAKLGDFDLELVQEFFQAFCTHAGISLHVSILAGSNLHHISEACFKALGVCLDQETLVDPRKKDRVPSTKGLL